MPEVLSYICPYCGTEVRVGEPCPGCAKKIIRFKPARPKKPWEQDPSADGLDLPGGDFDYEDFVAREFGTAPHKQLGVKWYWWLLGIIILLAMAAGAFMLR